MSVEELYELYMTEGHDDFGRDVYKFMGGAKDLEDIQWSADYGMYIPAYDENPVIAAEIQKDINLASSFATSRHGRNKRNREYREETADIRSMIDEELSGGMEAAGRLGLRSGSLEGAISDTIAQSGDKVEDLSKRFKLANEKATDDTNATTVQSTLDFEESEYQNKRNWYDSVMNVLHKLVEAGQLGVEYDASNKRRCEGCGSVSAENHDCQGEARLNEYGDVECCTRSCTHEARGGDDRRTASTSGRR